MQNLHKNSNNYDGLVVKGAAGVSVNGSGEPHPRRINICLIAAYERCPRRAINPAYERLKASIHREGLMQPLVVTRRPGSASYVLSGGGATRLRIVKELATETGSARFATVPCLFQSWRGESEMLLAHLKENELRGAIDIVDLGAALVDVKTLLEGEVGATLDDGRRLARRLQSLGLDIDHKTISLAIYAAKRLSDVLPLAVRGLRRSDIDRVRSLDWAARALWRDWSIDVAAEYDDVFRTLCARDDGPGWDVLDLRRALAKEMAVRSDRNAQEVSLELQARLSQSHVGAEAGSWVGVW